MLCGFIFLLLHPPSLLVHRRPIAVLSAGGPLVDWNPSVASDASMLYSRRAILPCLDLAPSMPSDCHSQGPALPLSSAVSIVSGGSAVCCPPTGAPLLLLATCILVAWVVGGFSSPPPAPVRPPLVCLEPLWGLLGFRPPWAPRPLHDALPICGASTMGRVQQQGGGRKR